jgi:hypothetical protein
MTQINTANVGKLAPASNMRWVRGGASRRRRCFERHPLYSDELEHRGGGGCEDRQAGGTIRWRTDDDAAGEIAVVLWRQ